MCTVTIVPFRPAGAAEDNEDEPASPALGHRLISNRDELRTRGRAEPPKQRVADGAPVLMPRDPDAGGTWIAVGEHGLVLTLLNVNPREAVKPSGPAPTRSRGHIIPMLAGCTSLGFVQGRLEGIAPSVFRPFRLIALLDGRVLEAKSDGARIHYTEMAADRPLFFTSSGLGDHIVEPPRRDLFEEMVLAAETAPKAPADDARLLERQRAFHRHAWPERPHVSVCMAREDALTVSCTEVDVLSDRIVMRHLDGPPTADSDDDFLELMIDRRRAVDRPAAAPS